MIEIILSIFIGNKKKTLSAYIHLSKEQIKSQKFIVYKLSLNKQENDLKEKDRVHHDNHRL